MQKCLFKFEGMLEAKDEPRRGISINPIQSNNDHRKKRRVIEKMNAFRFVQEPTSPPPRLYHEK